MSEPRFLTVDSIHFLHHRSIARYGGTLGVRDAGGLESAVLQPMNTYYYGGGDLFDIAAAYAYHIALPKPRSTLTAIRGLRSRLASTSWKEMA